MLKAAVTVGCSAAMIAAAVLSSWLRDTRRTPSPLSGREPFGERLGVTVGRTGGMLIGASLAGVLTIGAGSRQDHPARAEIVGTKANPGRVVVMALGGLGGMSIVFAAGQVLTV